MAIIEVKDLSKKYEYYKKQPGLWASVKSLFSREKLFKDAVRDISFKIEEGELVGFLGPNGAGKTTTLKMLSGILHPDGGQARVLGFDPYERQAEYQKQFALVMGNKNQLWWDLPAMESFVLNKEIYEVSDEDFKKNLDELVELLDLKDVLDVQVRKLSLGQRMKCELVAALLHKPKVLFLDEPTLGLDVVAQKNVRDFVRKYNKLNKTTIILTSHYMEDIKELCERVIIIDKGKIIYDGKLDELIKKYAPYKKIKIIFDGEKISRDQLSEFGEVDEINSHFASLKVPREKTKEIASRILISSLPVDDILIDEMQADEVIRGIFSKEGAEV
ncbi:MAG: ABC transporter related-protein [Candidatus Moranbacteria bacterium GW2011_GWE2_35_2-]|nr:MAG: ABC transporter related-protein [Candidatus Moranbacteria bacterium GW2011_GWE2_35_2-]KKQ21912.1 MAG: ABC transporter related-protein [Candidatus Moranbacteria bacterium GW2011_GWF2_37_11]KKQ29410.1 MAG: ABC transporter related-protein [Candidatus Moranbacteria bacterium GW2011_GWD1_37_17]KKQ30721.1 MAG: ABC transporter related-protein [Candidatus Moranbacteria bacterium GW2011_GWE1_37_24]KKQ47128.1 MAG: ABC transporter related-protein [Candidatus Moranbacteria bacterium GW2011_GWD2_37_